MNVSLIFGRLLRFPGRPAFLSGERRFVVTRPKPPGGPSERYRGYPYRVLRPDQFLHPLVDRLFRYEV